MSEHIYAPNAIKAGCAGYVHKTSKLENLGIAIVKVNQGQIILNERNQEELSTYCQAEQVGTFVSQTF